MSVIPIAMSSASSPLSDDELIAYKKSFYQCFDRDKDGTLTTQELGNVLRNLGQNPTEAELQELVIQLDQNKNGTVEFEELLAVITNPSLLEGGPVDETEELREIFNVIDKDRNGMIGYSDLKSIIASSGLEIPEHDVERMIDEADRDNDKQLSFDDFFEILRPNPAQTSGGSGGGSGGFGMVSPENLADLAAQAAASLSD